MRRFIDPHHFKTWLSILILVAAAIIIFHLVSEFSIFMGWILAFFGIIAPFIWGFMISYALNLPRERFEVLLGKINHPFAEKHKRGLSVAVTYLALLVIIFLVVLLIAPRIYESITDFINFLPDLLYNIDEFLLNLGQNESVPFINMAVADSFNTDAILDLFNADNLAIALNTIFGLAGTLFRLGLALISSIYFLVEAERVKAFTARVLRAIMPSKIYPTFMKYVREINSYFKRYIYCQVLDAVILGTIMTIAMSIMGVGYAFVLGPMLGFANLIPLLGSIIGTVIAILIIMLTDGVQLGLLATVVLILIQQFDANFIFPRLLGGSMKIPPLLVIIGITVGSSIYGILGMILAIPIVTVLRNIIHDILTHIEARKLAKKQGGAL